MKILDKNKFLPLNPNEYIQFLKDKIPSTLPILFALKPAKAITMRMSSLEVL